MRRLVAGLFVLVLVGCGSVARSAAPATAPAAFSAADYGRLDVRDLSKSPDRYKGQRIYYRATVFHFIPGNNGTLFQVMVGQPTGSGLDQIAVVSAPQGTDGIHEGDLLDIWGTVLGAAKITTLAGASTEQPELTADRMKPVSDAGAPPSEPGTVPHLQLSGASPQGGSIDVAWSCQVLIGGTISQRNGTGNLASTGSTLLDVDADRMACTVQPQTSGEAVVAIFKDGDRVAAAQGDGTQLNVTGP